MMLKRWGQVFLNVIEIVQTDNKLLCVTAYYVTSVFHDHNCVFIPAFFVVLNSDANIRTATMPSWNFNDEVTNLILS